MKIRIVAGLYVFYGGTLTTGYIQASYPMKSLPKRKQFSQRKQRKQEAKLLETIFGLGGIAIALALTLESKPAVEFARNGFAALQISEANPDCLIKGNISISSGKKLYHLPGMEDYESTNIEAVHGEKWFCTEAEAISNGWVKAPK